MYRLGQCHLRNIAKSYTMAEILAHCREESTFRRVACDFGLRTQFQRAIHSTIVEPGVSKSHASVSSTASLLETIEGATRHSQSLCDLHPPPRHLVSAANQYPETLSTLSWWGPSWKLGRAVLVTKSGRYQARTCMTSVHEHSTLHSGER